MTHSLKFLSALGIIYEGAEHSLGFPWAMVDVDNPIIVQLNQVPAAVLSCSSRL